MQDRLTTIEATSKRKLRRQAEQQLQQHGQLSVLRDELEVREHEWEAGAAEQPSDDQSDT